MRRFGIVLLILFFTLFTGCEKFVIFDFYFPIQYDDSVYLFIPERTSQWVKDTSICFSKEELQLVKLDNWGNSKIGAIDFAMGTVEHQFYEWGCDTVSFFIFDRDIVENYSWQYIVQEYCVLQRYDFSEQDLIRLRCQIPYPPTEEMKDMHMYPPYQNAALVK